ncbi:MAG: RsmB/NOP family class I SAM-dependent RNA methyltransferase, partial [Spirochaetales bacterium]|nr:RsmB/NOP family class I SAM-dependent RNA methyltransferase [Spirochaetales bacterium]
LWATDVAEFKLTELKKRVARAGWQNVRVQLWDGRLRPTLPREAQVRGGFDRVVVDAPCSASGTWRRDPDARYRLNPGVLKALEDKQATLLQHGWEALRPGGLLTYITCSWLPRENEDQVLSFEKRAGSQSHRRLERMLGLPAYDANTMFICQWEKRTESRL